MSTMNNLLVAVRKNNMVKVRNLVNNGTDINVRDENGYTIMHFNSGYDKDGIPFAQHLIDMGADIHATDNVGKDPLHVAVLAGNADYVRILLSLGSKQVQDGYGETPIFIAKFRGYTEIAKMLTKDGLVIQNDEKQRLYEIGYSLFLSHEKILEMENILANTLKIEY